MCDVPNQNSPLKAALEWPGDYKTATLTELGGTVVSLLNLTVTSMKLL